MDPQLLVSNALAALDEIINMIKHIKGQGALTTEQIAAQADAQDLENKADIKALLAL